RVAHDIAVADRDLAFIGGFQEGSIHDLRRAAHVEGTHGELGARLTDRLRRDDAHGLADIDRRTTCKVAAVANGTDARADIASQRRADSHRLDARLLDRIHVTLVD